MARCRRPRRQPSEGGRWTVHGEAESPGAGQPACGRQSLRGQASLRGGSRPRASRPAWVKQAGEGGFRAGGQGRVHGESGARSAGRVHRESGARSASRVHRESGAQSAARVHRESGAQSAARVHRESGARSATRVRGERAERERGKENAWARPAASSFPTITQQGPRGRAKFALPRSPAGHRSRQVPASRPAPGYVKTPTLPSPGLDARRPAPDVSGAGPRTA